MSISFECRMPFLCTGRGSDSDPVSTRQLGDMICQPVHPEDAFWGWWTNFDCLFLSVSHCSVKKALSNPKADFFFISLCLVSS